MLVSKLEKGTERRGVLKKKKWSKWGRWRKHRRESHPQGRAWGRLVPSLSSSFVRDSDRPESALSMSASPRTFSLRSLAWVPATVCRAPWPCSGPLAAAISLFHGAFGGLWQCALLVPWQPFRAGLASWSHNVPYVPSQVPWGEILAPHHSNRLLCT